MKKNTEKPSDEASDEANVLDPPIVSAAPPLALEKCVGTTVRALRLRHRLTITQVAEQAGISGGMLSKIENGQISAGMETLSRVARALGSSMAMLFRTYDVPAGTAHLVKRGEGMPVLRQGTRPGHTFQLLSYDQGPTKAFDAFMVTITEQTENLPTIEHPGIELIHVLEGSMDYRIGQTLYQLQPGDTLTFQGEVLHGFERLIELPIRFLCTIVYTSPQTPQS